MTMWLHPYVIVNGCLLSKGSDQIAATYSAAKMTETVAFDSLFYVWARTFKLLQGTKN